MSLVLALLGALRAARRPRTGLTLENLALRQQLALLRRRSRPAIRPPRSLALGAALATMGRLARSASHHSPRDGHRLASAGLSRLLDLEISAQALGSSVRRSGACPPRPHHGARKYSLGCAAHPWRTAQVGVRGFAADRRTSHAAPAEATLADLAHFPPEPRRRSCLRGLLPRADCDIPAALCFRGSPAPSAPSRPLQRHRNPDGSLDRAADRRGIPQG